MNCPMCNAKSKVSETIGDEEVVFRTHKCQNCGYSFITKEEADVSEEDYLYLKELRNIKQMKQRSKNNIKLTVYGSLMVKGEYSTVL